MEFGKDYIIRYLRKTDKIKNFSMGAEEFLPLKSFLKNQAFNFSESYIAQTYVCIQLDEKLEDTGKVIAYLTLVCSEIDLKDAYSLNDCEYANKYDSLPAIKIARLAIDKKFRNKQLGSALIQYAVFLVAENIAPKIGCRFLITDAKKPSVEFYKKCGFVFLDAEDNYKRDEPLMFLDLKSI